MRALVLRLDAPLMSFGTVMVDRHGFIDRFPGTAMLTGLIANALGWRHGDFDKLQQLQERIEYAARWDTRPEELIDYHTVDLGQPKMRDPGWTTRGESEHRGGGNDAKFGTHERIRYYWADGLMTIVLGVKGGLDPDLDTIRAALHKPARPLFFGRKACLPSRPLLDPHTPILEGNDVLSILRRVPVWDRHGTATRRDEYYLACWPAEIGVMGRGEIRRVYDLRDWANQVPAGSWLRAEGLIKEERA